MKKIVLLLIVLFYIGFAKLIEEPLTGFEVNDVEFGLPLINYGITAIQEPIGFWERLAGFLHRITGAISFYRRDDDYGIYSKVYFDSFLRPNGISQAEYIQHAVAVMNSINEKYPNHFVKSDFDFVDKVLRVKAYLKKNDESKSYFVTKEQKVYLYYKVAGAREFELVNAVPVDTNTFLKFFNLMYQFRYIRTDNCKTAYCIQDMKKIYK